VIRDYFEQKHGKAADINFRRMLTHAARLSRFANNTGLQSPASAARWWFSGNELGCEKYLFSCQCSCGQFGDRLLRIAGHNGFAALFTLQVAQFARRRFVMTSW